MILRRFLVPGLLLVGLQASEPPFPIRLSHVDGLDFVSWPAVTGATQYAIFAFKPGAKRPVWSWMGTATTVAVGDPLDPAMEEVVRYALARKPEGRLNPADALEYAAMAFDARGALVRVRPRSRP